MSFFRGWLDTGSLKLSRLLVFASIIIALSLSGCVFGIFIACDTDNECAVDQFCDVGGVCIFFDTCPGCFFQEIDGNAPAGDAIVADEIAPESRN